MMNSKSASSKLAHGKRGMISSAHPQATEAGLGILQQGGNAFDAAVTTAAALNVLEPMNSGVGGYGTILVYDAIQGECRYLNSSDRIPRGVNSDLFRPPAIEYKANRRGAKAVSTPGNLRAWDVLSQTYGSLPWATLFEPAVKLAKDGVSVSSELSRYLQRDYDVFPVHAREIYGHNGHPFQTGELLEQHDLAKTLSQIAGEGAEIFYSGSLGRRIVHCVKEAEGFLRQVDLDHCTAEWRKPIGIEYREHQIFTASPPATSFSALIRLGLLSQFDIRALGHNTPDTLHLFAEITKHAYRSRLAYAADPEVSSVPLEELLSPEHWREEASKFNRRQAEPFSLSLPGSNFNQHTTHFVVADGEGNIVSATQTIGQEFGSRLMPAGTGIWLNNSLQYCTFEPKGNPMDAHAGRHKLSGDCPVIVLRGGIPWAALGTPGGHTITQTVPQIVMNLIDFGMDMAEAIEQPRIGFVEPDQLLVDPSLATDTKIALASLGLSIRDFAEGLGNAHGLTIEYDESKEPVHFSGAADPRGGGLAKGLRA